MSIQNELQLAETLRVFLIENAPLPVPGRALNLDTLLPAGRSMNLQVTGGEVVRVYIDGSKIMRTAFTLFYRAGVTDDNSLKSDMQGSLNAIGAWMEKIMRDGSRPYLGDWLEVTGLQQVQRANIAAQDEKSITYQAGYVLGYRTK